MKKFADWLAKNEKNSIKVKKKPKYRPLYLSIRKREKDIKENWEGSDLVDDSHLKSISHKVTLSPKDKRETYLMDKHNELNDHYHVIHKYHPHEGEALDDYAVDSSGTNRDLIDCHHEKRSITTLEGWRQEHIRQLDSAMRKRKTPKNMHVFSGVGFDPHQIFKTHKEGHFHAHLPAYTSTSIDHDIAKSFAHSKAKYGAANIIKIHVPKGSHGVYMGDKHGYESEKEFVLARNAKLRIHPQPSVSKKFNVNVWHAKLVHDGVTKTSHWKDHIDNEQ